MACEYCGLDKTVTPLRINYENISICDDCLGAFTIIKDSVHEGHHSEFYRPGNRLLMAKLNLIHDDIRAIKTKVGA